MQETNNNKRIAKNTLMLYLRSLFSMAISFYTSRLILSTLGVVDYGIYNAVGGVAALFSFLNSSLSGATSRFLTVSLGEGDMEKMKKTFSAAVTMHLVLAIIILVLCETIGVWLLENKMVIPEERMDAARILLQISILSVMVNISQVPYTSALIAHEHMGIYAYVGIIDVVLKLIIVFIVAAVPWDRLVVYSAFFFCVNLLSQLIPRFYALRKFEECNTKLSRDKALISPMIKFSGWDLYGNMSTMARTQGINVLQNMFHGPVVNAAAGVSGWVMGAVLSFSSNFIMAVRPQIIKLYAKHEISEMQRLAERGARMAFFLLFFISFPCFLELPIILDLWLEEVPEYSAIFTRLSLVFNWVVIVFFPLSAIIHATGRMKRISIINGTLYLMVVPVTYVAFKFFGMSPIIPYVFNALFGFIGGLINLQTVKLYVADFDFRHYLLNAPIRGYITAVIGAFVPIVLYYLLDYGWGSFFVVCTVCILTNGIAILYVGLNKHEREVLVKSILIKLHLIRE